MAIHTLLLEFPIPVHSNRQEAIPDLVLASLQHCYHFGNGSLQLLAKSSTNRVSTYIFNGPRDSLLTIRVYTLKLLCTVTLEYVLEDGDQDLITHEECRELELKWTNNMPGTRTKRSTTIPPILRGTSFDIYFPSTDKRILQYDIDKMLYNAVSPFQHIQIAHSTTYGNMLILDGDPNLAESDLIYTESLLRRGVEFYEGKEILILGGGDGGLLQELLKENPKQVTMIEIDEMVIDACRTHLRSVCDDVLDNLSGDNYEIIVEDCRPHLLKLREAGFTFDYIFDDLTTIPVNGNTDGDKSLLELQQDVLESACALLKPSTGKLMAHGPGASGLNSTKLFEDILYKSVGPSSKIKLDKQIAFVPSFMENWAFYKVEVESVYL